MNCIRSCILVFVQLLLSMAAFAQTVPSGSATASLSPSGTATCVVSAMNRNATMVGNDYYMIHGVPSGAGPYRIRAVCSDGTLGQSAPVRPSTSWSGSVIDAGAITWGQVTPIPASLELTGPAELSFGDTAQYRLVARMRDGSTQDVTAASGGAGFKVTPSPWWDAQRFASAGSPSSSIYGDTFSDGGQFKAASPGYAYQVLLNATYEGVAVAKVVRIGPWASLRGRVTLPDGSTAVGGARVEIQRLAPSVRTPDILTTDAAGQFAQISVPAGDYRISVTDPATGGRALRTTTLALGNAANLAIALNGSGAVNVNVVTAGNAPVAGAQVVLSHGQIAGQVQSLPTAASGVAAFAQFMAGPVNVTVRDPATGAVGSGRLDLLNGATAGLSIMLQPVGQMAGRVLAADGVTPQASVQVRLLTERGPVAQAVTGAEGTFRFDSLSIGDSPYTLQAYQDGQLKAAKAGLVLASAGQQLQQDLVFGVIQAGGIVSGRALDDGGQPYANAGLRLDLASGASRTAQTDAAGNFFINGVPAGAFTLNATASGYAGQAGGSMPAQGGEVTLTLRVSVVGEVRGLVQSSSGQPVAGAVVDFMAAGGYRQATTDASGAFVFAAVPVGAYSLSVQDPASGERGQLLDAVASGGEVRTPLVRLAAVGTVLITARYNGQPVAGAKVSLTTHGRTVFGAMRVSDAAGQVQFSGVPQGSYSVSVVSQVNATSGRAGQLRGTLTGSQDAQVVNLNRSTSVYSIAGRVVTAQGQAVANAMVKLSTREMPVGGTVPIPNSQWDEHVAQTDGAGNFAFNGLWVYDDGRGRVKLDALVNGKLRGRVVMTTPGAGQSVPQDVVLFDAGLVYGQVRNAAGAAMPGAQVQVVHPDTFIYSPEDFITYVDSSGIYGVEVPTGALSATARMNGLQSAQQTPQVSAGQLVRADLVLNGWILSGRVMSSSGAPVANAIVRGNSSDASVNSGYEATTDASGRYELALLPGTAYVKALSGTRTSVVSNITLGSHRTMDFFIAGIPPRVSLSFGEGAGSLSFRVTLNNVSFAAAARTGDIYSTNLAAGDTGQFAAQATTGFSDTVQASLTVQPQDEGATVPVQFAGALVRVKPNPAGLAPGALFDLYIDGRLVGRMANGDSMLAYLRTDQPRALKIVTDDDRFMLGTLNVAQGDAGTIVTAPLAVSGPQPLLDEFTFAESRNLFSVPLNAGDVLSVRVHGALAPSGKSTYLVRAAVFDPANVARARGYGYGSSFNYQQYSSVGDLMAVTAQAQGNYAVQVEPYYPYPDYIGGYYLQLLVNGQPVAVQPYAGGGEVRGRVAYGDGAPAQAQLLRVAGNLGSEPNTVVQTGTDANGFYSVLNLPAGVAEVKALGFDGTVFGTASGTVTAGGALTANLVISRHMTLDVSVRLAGQVAPASYIYLTVSDDLGVRNAGPLYFNGSATSDVLRIGVVGETATLRATHPFNAAYYGEAVARASNGVQQQVQVVLSTAQLTGRVVNSAQEPVSGALVTAYGDGGRYLDSGYTDSQGVYAMAAVPAGVPLALTAELSGIQATASVSAQEGQTATVPDIVLAASGAAGRVRYADLSPAAGLQVEAQFADGNATYATTDDQGRYVFPALPVGQLVTVRASHPGNGVVVSTQFTPQAGPQAVVPDLVFAATSSLTGRVRFTNGQPVANALVLASTSAEPASCGFYVAPPDTPGGPLLRPKAQRRGPLRAAAQDFSFEVSTDAAGNYVFDDVPTDVSLLVSTAYGSLSCFQASQPVNVPTGGVSGPLPDLVIDAPAGSLKLQIVDGIGTPLASPLPTWAGECETRLVISGPGLSGRLVNVPPLEGSVYDGVAAGDYSAELSNQCLGNEPLGRGVATVGASGSATLSIVLPVLRGNVVFADGTDPSSVSVSITQRDAEGNRKTIYGIINDGGGIVDGPMGRAKAGAPLRSQVQTPTGPNSFILFGMGLGDYELQASDNEFGVSLTQTGTFATPAGGIMNLVLPPTAVVKGCTKDTTGASVSPGVVVLQSFIPGSPPNGGRSTSPGDDGCYEFRRVPSGNVSLYAAGGEEGRVSFTVQAQVDNTVLTQDVRYQLPGTLRVRVTDAAGTPLANRQVQMRSMQMDWLYGGTNTVQTDASGYATADVYPGLYSVSAWSSSSLVGGTDLRVVSEQTTTATLAMTGRYLMTRDSSELYRDALTTSDDVRFMLSYYDARLFSYGSLAYFGFYEGPALYVNGMVAGYVDTADFPPGAREIKLGPFAVGDGLEVTRRLFVPVAGGYARVIDSVRNRSAGALTAVVESRSNDYEYCGLTQITQPQNSSARGFVAYRDCRAAVGHVYSSPTGAVQPSVVKLLSNGGKTTQWTLTVPPGDTSAVMHFFLLKQPDQQVELESKAAELAGQTEPSMLEGLSAADKQSIRNFNVGP